MFLRPAAEVQIAMRERQLVWLNGLQSKDQSALDYIRAFKHDRDMLHPQRSPPP